MTALIVPDLVALDADLGPDSHAVIRALAAKVAADGRATDPEALAAGAIAREEKTPTGIPGGIGIPHTRNEAVTAASLAMARLSTPVDFGAKDGPADLVFLIAAPAGANEEHLALLSKLARNLMKKPFLASLRGATSEQEVVDVVETALGLRPAEASAADAPAAGTGAEAAAPAAATAPAEGSGTSATSGAPAEPARRRTVVAVTACATGIAHTYMAADALEQAGAEMGVDIRVEPQGSSGTTPLDPQFLADADAAVFAVDVDVRDKGRFAGKPYIQVPVKRGIDEPQELIRRALAVADDPQGARLRVAAGEQGENSGAAGTESFGAELKRVLLTGVSYMIPFVAGGGLLMALGFLLGGYNITDFADTITVENSLWNLPTEFPDIAMGPVGAYLGAVFFKIGNLSMGFLVAALAGYIAYGLADRPGIAPGFTVGAVAAFMGAGFIGGIIGGLIAGYAARWIGGLPAPRWLRGLMPVVIIPLAASIIASGLMFLVLGNPIAWLMGALTTVLSGMTGSAAVLLGIVLGVMMAADLGGPINKVAYSFAVAGLGAGSVDNPAPLMIMATVMAAGMVPPLALALATTLRGRLFTPAERENGKAAWLLGAAFISEGAIPFAASDPFRVIPAGVVGAATTGALTMLFGVTSQAPHGGVFVFFAIDSFLLFVLSIAIGTVVSALLVIVLKQFVGARRPETEAPAAAAEPALH
ncbi:fructose-specific PTS transporter subunit EIIC [Brevibacterium samyangense]|uniref:Fructose-specific PTS transporter subunit EIIC n=1 Tax=Brevibacterium samyangense TaxID=366888 RepID=A0ABP5EUN8_9MICO